MRGHAVLYLLAAALAAACLSASAEEPDISGSGMWGMSPYSLKDPIRQFYVGNGKPLGYAKGHQTSQYATYAVWGKYVYATPEKRGDKLIAEEWVALHLDCAKLTYTVDRYMEFDDKGNVLTDDQTIRKPKKVLMTWDDPNHMPIAEQTAATARGDTCTFDSD